ncbi:VOC family protein [Candidatus Halocynthiibacter alkanivorans]|jgi:catechol 2,3-dioxygenase-like lactoylglutathione lyase family enzyme|uniref:VOC family protein n=1 Tax=Candidatus Halocynthiibacter alkanivorans TaxID=2267619 RepID=UPI000DF1A572|nr:VOC family protein [Candidatus Halocynthiibacter alkanivorans]
MNTRLEHANITVSDPDATAQWLCEVFGWQIRWQGEAINEGRSIHVGSAESYLALYNPGNATGAADNSYATTGGLNHLAVVVEDLDATEVRVRAAGFTTGNHADYEPGRRFYFRDHDGIEFEVVQY